jgi:hypothetical protein
VKAQQLHDRLKAEAWERVKLGAKPRVKWAVAASKWLQDYGSKKSIADDRRKLVWLDEKFGERHLDELTTDLIHRTVEEGKADQKPATRNRYYALIKAILKKAAGK